MLRILLTVALLMGTIFAQAPASEHSQDGNAADAQAQAGHRRGTGGTITAIASGKITIKTIDGKSDEIILDDQTQFHVDRQPAKLNDFKVGDAVLVRGEDNGSDQWHAELVAKRSNNTGENEFREALGKKFIVGEIKAINGLQLTILRPDGVAQTIAVDENTSFHKQGESVTLADFNVGDKVFGRGEMKSDIFVPAVLGWGDPMSMFGGQSAPPPTDKPKGK